MIYFTDGTKEAFLTAFLCAFHDEEAQITSSNKQLTLGQQCIYIQADFDRAKRAEKRLLQFDNECMDDLSLLLRSGEPMREQVAFRYLKFLALQRCPVKDMHAAEEVATALNCIRRVTFEIHRLKGFVRFMVSESGVLYAPIAPDADICDLLVPHFRARLPEYPFVLHDVPRKKAAVCDGKNVFTAPLEKATVVLSADELAWQSLFRNYYKSVNIPSRERLKQMRGYMPVRYWKFLPELMQNGAKSDDLS